MKITITINTDNAAFDESTSEGHEVARILRALADKAEDVEVPQLIDNLKLRDANGNTCGSVTVEES